MNPRRILAAATLTLSLVGCSGRGGAPTPTTEASPEASPTVAAPTLPPGTVTEIPVAEGPNTLTATANAIWVEGHRANIVSRIDPANDREVERLEDVTAHCVVSSGGGAVWATNAHANVVTKVDPENGAVLGKIEIPDACGVAADEQDLWIVSPGLGRVFRYDVATLTRKAEIELGPNPFLVAIGTDAIWVAGEASGGILYRIDPATNTKVTEISVKTPFASGLAVGFGAVWVLSRELSAIYRVDPATNTIAATIKMRSLVGGIAVGSSAIWASGWEDGTIHRIDPTTNEITDSIDTDYGTLGPLLEAFDSLWVSAMDRNLVLRIDPGAIVD